MCLEPIRTSLLLVFLFHTASAPALVENIENWVPGCVSQRMFDPINIISFINHNVTVNLYNYSAVTLGVSPRNETDLAEYLYKSLFGILNVCLRSLIRWRVSVLRYSRLWLWIAFFVNISLPLSHIVFAIIMKVEYKILYKLHSARSIASLSL